MSVSVGMIAVLVQACVFALAVLWMAGDLNAFGFDLPWLLLLLPALLWFAWREHRGTGAARMRFSLALTADELPQSLAQVLRPAVIGLGFFGLLFVLLAAARPQSERSAERDFTEGIDIIFALDVSGSMEAADFKPDNRLAVAKNVLAEVITQRKSDRIGLVVFSGEAYTQVPLTLDYNVLVNLLGDIRTGVIADGTAIGDALGTSVNRLRDESSKTRVVILLTDGDNNAGTLPPLEAASIAADLGVRIYTILIGRDGPVPFPAGKDLLGNIVYQQQKIPINPDLLKQISEKTKGLYFRAEDRDALKSTLMAALDHLEKTRFEDSTSSIKTELYRPFLMAGLLLLGLYFGLKVTRFREAV